MDSNCREYELKDRIESKSITTEHTSIVSTGDDDDDDDDDISTTSSDEALYDVLGLPSLSAVGMGMGMGIVMVEEDESGECEEGPLQKQTAPKQAMHRVVSRRIDLPSVRGVSRKYHDRKECLAYEIQNILSPDECLELIRVAANSSRNESNSTLATSFRYITHAVHTAPDGQTKFEVKLERPNPHKLAVFRHESWVKLLWERIEPLFHNYQQHENENENAESSLKQAIERFIHREALSVSESYTDTSSASPIAGLNPRLRVLKYDACDEDEFKGHFDATTEIHSLGQTSYLTVLLYLNNGGGGDFDGGETEFLSQEEKGAKDIQSSGIPCSRSVKVTPRAGSVVLFEHDLFHRGRPLLWGTKYVLRTDVMFIDYQKHSADISSTREKVITPSPSLPHKRTNDDGKSAALLSTVEDVLSLIEQELGFSNKQEAADDCEATGSSNESTVTLLRKALSEGFGFGEDLHDTTIECLCSPGRFALNLVLREHMQENHHQKMIDRFLNFSFDAINDQS